MEMLKHRFEDESRARATADSRILEVGVLHYVLEAAVFVSFCRTKIQVEFITLKNNKDCFSAESFCMRCKALSHLVCFCSYRSCVAASGKQKIATRDKVA